MLKLDPIFPIIPRRYSESFHKYEYFKNFLNLGNIINNEELNEKLQMSMIPLRSKQNCCSIILIVPNVETIYYDKR